jgi:AraC family transcriptional regulator of adaptative response / methylphosphotriester-DNA alkyltransferase methyltransferase
MTLTADEKWKAVVRCDDTFDNQFIYGVKTTGIFCRPSCKSKTPLRENVEFFENVEAAYAYGLRPCKRCRPDLQIYKPAADIMEKSKKIYDNYFNNNTELHLHIDKLNISRSHLNRVYQKFYGITPKEYISRLRMEKAVLLLADKNIL